MDRINHARNEDGPEPNQPANLNNPRQNNPNHQELNENVREY